MMDCELQSTGDFRRVESELIDKLDTYVSGGGRGDDRFKDTLFKILSVETSKYPELQKAGVSQFIESMTQLLSRLLEFRNVPEGEENRNQRMSTISNLLHLYREMEREEMYLRYIYKLCNMHLQWGHYTEAAFTLMLHARKLEWHDFPGPRVPGKYAEATTERRLKEMLYQDIIEYFDKGKLWEFSITVSKELAQHYEMAFDYDRLSNIYRTIGDSFHKIVHSVRAVPSYFRVGFYGRGFLPSLRNKLFIFRGGEYENIGDFNARLTAEFASAQMLKKSTPPEADILQSPGQYIQTCTVEPLPEDPDRFQGQNVAETIRGFHTHNDVRQFRVDRPFHRGPKDKENEFATLWIERTTYQTVESLPGILRWSEVQSQPHSVELCPVENALESVLNRNKDMRRVIAQCVADPSQGVMTLGMSLNGIIDAAVNGGVAKYEMAFLVPEYLKTNAEHAELVAKLRDTITEQVEICGEALALHGRFAPGTLQPFQQKMEEMYESLKKKYPPGRRSLRFLREASFRSQVSPVVKQLRTRPDSEAGMRSSVSYSSAVSPDRRSTTEIIETGTNLDRKGGRFPKDPLPPVPLSPGSVGQDIRRHSEFIPGRSWTMHGEDRPVLPAKSGKPRSHTQLDQRSPMNRPPSVDTGLSGVGLTPPPKPARPMVAVSVPQLESGEKRPPKPYRPPSVVLPDQVGVNVSPPVADVATAKPPKLYSMGSPATTTQSPLFSPGLVPVSSVVSSLCETTMEVDVVDPKPEFVPKFIVSNLLPSNQTQTVQEVNGQAPDRPCTPPPPAPPPKQHKLKSVSKEQGTDSQWLVQNSQSIDSRCSLASNQSIDSVDSIPSPVPALPPRGNVLARLAQFGGGKSPPRQREDRHAAEFPYSAPSETDL
jgi:hypothetical protein